MKKIIFFILFPFILSAQSGIKVKDLPTTTSGSTSDYLIKDDAAGTSGSTKKISFGNTLTTYSILTTGKINGTSGQITISGSSILTIGIPTPYIGIGTSTIALGSSKTFSVSAFANDAGYVLSNGSSGGQVLYGGTGSGQSLGLFSNQSNNGNILFGVNSSSSANTYDEANNKWYLNSIATSTLVCNGKVTIADGTQTDGYVYTCNSAGVGHWAAPSGGSGTISGSGTAGFAAIWSTSVALGSFPLSYSFPLITSVGASLGFLGGGTIYDITNSVASYAPDTHIINDLAGSTSVDGANRNLDNSSAAIVYDWQNKQFFGVHTGTISLATNATQLRTARTINGTSFNGTANINIFSGTIGKLPYYTTTTTFTDSPVFTDGTSVAIGNTSPTGLFHVTSGSGVIPFRISTSSSPIGVSSSGLMSIGTFTTDATNVPRLYIKGSGNTSSAYGLEVVNSSLSPYFVLRNDSKMLYTDGTQGTNKVLVDDGTGNGIATWATIGNSNIGLAYLAFNNGIGTFTTSLGALANITAISGNAGTASIWATARNLNITGDGTYSVSIDGSSNVTGALTLSSIITASVVGNSTSIPIITYDAKGRITSVSSATISASGGASYTAGANISISTGNSISTILNPTFTQETNPLIIGGTGSTNFCTYQSSSSTTFTLTGTAHKFKGGSNGGTTLINLLNDNRMGLGVAAPLGFLHLKSGTTSYPPLILGDALSTPALMSSPTYFALETDGGANLYYTNSALQRQQVWLVQSTYCSSDYSSTTTTLGDVTGLTATVKTGKTYKFEANLFLSPNVTGGGKVGVQCNTSTTAFISDIIFTNITTGNSLAAGRITSAGSSVTGSLGTTTNCKITGFITNDIDGDGTLTIQFAESTATGTSKVLTGSTFIVTQLN